MTQKRKYLLFFLMALVVISISIIACAGGGQSNSEVESLQEQVNALATQNAMLLEQIGDSTSGSTTGEVDAPQPPSGNQEPQIQVAEPTPETLPDGPVPAGMPITFDGWTITVSPELRLNHYKNWWGIDIYVRNLGENKRVFRFVNAAITASDNLGNEYEMSPECPSMMCNSCVEHHYEIKNLNIDGGKSKVISSGTNGNACYHIDGIHLFKGPIPLNASSLIISFADFGPFNGVEVVIDL